MKTRPAAAAAILLTIGAPAFAHRLDEYLQATILSIDGQRVHASMRLAPGVAVSSFVLAGIDRDADGVLSAVEVRAYAERVVAGLSLSFDGDPVPLRLVSSAAAQIEDLREGLGDIRLEVEASLPRRGGGHRLRFENHHQGPAAAYLVNCLVPTDPDIRITAQRRNDDQSVYELEYTEASGSISLVSDRWTRIGGWLGTAALLLFARSALPRRRRGLMAVGPRS